MTLLTSIWQKLKFWKDPVRPDQPPLLPDKPPPLHPNFEARKQEDDEIGAWTEDDY